MLANQATLPRWPLPSLDETLERYLDAVRRLRGDCSATEALVKEALAPGSPMRALHARLVEYDASKVARSFVSDFWDSMYFEGRDGIAVNSTPGIRLRTEVFHASGAQSQVHSPASS
jgi:carnitine O-acetyltransferase